MYISASPQQLASWNRSSDLEAIIDIISKATKVSFNAKDSFQKCSLKIIQFIYITVGEFIPKFIYTKDKNEWPVIYNTLVNVIIARKLKVKILCNENARFFNETSETLRNLRMELSEVNLENKFEARVIMVSFLMDF